MRKNLSTYLWEYKWYYLLGIMSLIVSVSLDMLAPMLTMHIIDDVILGGQINLLPRLLGGILIVGVGRVFFSIQKNTPLTEQVLLSPQTCERIYLIIYKV